MLKQCLGVVARYWLALSLLAILLLTALSLLSFPEQTPVPGNDKALHCIAWALAVAPAALALGLRAAPVVVVFLAWSIAIEFVQPLVGRYFEVADMLANAAGLTLGLGLGMALRRWPA